MSSTRNTWESAQSHFLFQDVIAPLRRFKDIDVLLAFVDIDEETASRHAAYIPRLFDISGATGSVRLFNVKVTGARKLVLIYDHLNPGKQVDAVLSYLNAIADYYNLNVHDLWKAIPFATDEEHAYARTGLKALKCPSKLNSMLNAQDFINAHEDKKARAHDQEDLSNRSTPSIPDMSDATMENKSITVKSQDPSPAPSPSPSSAYSSIEDSWVPLSFFADQFRRTNIVTPIFSSLLAENKFNKDDIAMNFQLS